MCKNPFLLWPLFLFQIHTKKDVMVKMGELIPKFGSELYLKFTKTGDTGVSQSEGFLTSDFEMTETTRLKGRANGPPGPAIPGLGVGPATAAASSSTSKDAKKEVPEKSHFFGLTFDTQRTEANLMKLRPFC